MRSEKDDRRVKYTKMVLKESFVKLLEKKEISQITIKEICEDADINRATFYAHYSDPYDLMRKMQSDLLENVEAYLAAFIQNDMAAGRVDIIERIFEYIKENARLCKLLLSEHGDLNFQKHLLMLMYDKNIADMTNGGAISKEDADYIFSFTLTGCVGMIQKWLLDDMPKSPRFMAEITLKLTESLPDLFANGKKPDGKAQKPARRL